MKSYTIASLILASASASFLTGQEAPDAARTTTMPAAAVSTESGSNASRAPFLAPSSVIVSTELTGDALDRYIESTARSSSTLSTLLGNKVDVSAKDGVATMTGSVEDHQDRALAVDTVSNIYGVQRVENKVAVKSTMVAGSDAAIASKIRSQLIIKSDASFANTMVNVVNRHVTLTGTTDTQAQKDRTGIHAQEVAFVQSVKNNLVVVAPTGPLPIAMMDDASVTSQVRAALRSHTSTNIKTTIKTTDGIVDLSGHADSEADKALATKLTEAVRGVKSVKNSMSVVRA